MCLGGHRGGIFSNCPYCDHQRYTYVEASFKYVCQYIHQLEPPQKHYIYSLLEVSQSQP